MKTQHINGSLVETRGVTPRTNRRIYDAVVETGVSPFVSTQGWDQGVMKFDHTSAVPEQGDTALDFIKRLNDMMWRVGITELGLKGQIVVTVNGEETTVYRVLVEDSKLSYRKAVLAWEPPVTDPR
jgi:hypothetical protein